MVGSALFRWMDRALLRDDDSFIRKVGELIQLSRKLKSQPVHEDAKDFPQSEFRNPQSISCLDENRLSRTPRFRVRLRAADTGAARRGDQ